MSCPDNLKESLPHKLSKEETSIPPDLSFIVHGYPQDIGASFHGRYHVRFYVLLILEDGQLKDSIAFASGNSLRTAAKGDEWKAGDVRNAVVLDAEGSRGKYGYQFRPRLIRDDD